jgi:hypothetical protein
MFNTDFFPVVRLPSSPLYNAPLEDIDRHLGDDIMRMWLSW